MYPTGHSNLAKDPSVMLHYMSVLLIIRPKKTCHGPVFLLVPHDVPGPLCDVPVPLHVTHILPGPLREIPELFCASQNLLKVCIFSFWMSLKLRKKKSFWLII
jgi:hypothetical protein